MSNLVSATMRPPDVLARVARGVQEHPYRSIVLLGSAYVVIWTVIEPIVTLTGVTPATWRFWVFLALAIIVAAWRVATPKSVSFVMRAARTRVEIGVGDVLGFHGHKVVAVNEFFDSALGDHVSPTSLHGQCIVHLFGSDSARFDVAVDAALDAGSAPVETTPRKSGRQRRYVIGTVAVVAHGPHKLFLPALARTDPSTLRAAASHQDLWMCLDQLWATIRTQSNGDPVAVPLLGAGQSGVPLSHQALLQTLLISLEAANRSGEITSPIHILLTPEVYDQVNLLVIEEEWR